MGVTVDTSELKRFQAGLEKLSKTQKREFFRNSTRQCAARLLSLVILDTPVDTGTLRRAWTCKTAEEAESGVERVPGAHARTLPVAFDGTGSSVDIVNPMEYASYVEYGHRQTPGRYVPAIGKRLVADWVEGQHMLDRAERNFEAVAPQTLEGLMERYLKRVL